MDRVAFSPVGEFVIVASLTERLGSRAQSVQSVIGTCADHALGCNNRRREPIDASVTALAVHGNAIALGDALGRIHVYDLERADK